MQTMMLLQEARFRAQAAQDRAKAAQDQAKAAKKVALEAEKDSDAAQKEVQELQRVMEPKRAKNLSRWCGYSTDVLGTARAHGTDLVPAETKVTRDLTTAMFKHLLVVSHPHWRSLSTHEHSFAADSGRKSA
jgi:hypothetical protein